MYNTTALLIIIGVLMTSLAICIIVISNQDEEIERLIGMNKLLRKEKFMGRVE